MSIALDQPLATSSDTEDAPPRQAKHSIATFDCAEISKTSTCAMSKNGKRAGSHSESLSHIYIYVIYLLFLLYSWVPYLGSAIHFLEGKYPTAKETNNIKPSSVHLSRPIPNPFHARHPMCIAEKEGDNESELNRDVTPQKHPMALPVPNMQNPASTIPSKTPL